MVHHEWRVTGLTALGICAVFGCSSSKSGTAPTGTGGCTGAACGVGGAGGLGAAGTSPGGAGNVGGAPLGTAGMMSATGGAAGSTMTSCTPLMLAAGATSPDGVVALHSPGPDAFGDEYGFNAALADGYVYFNFQSQLMRVPVGGGAAQSIHAVPSVNASLFVIGSDIVWVDQDPTTMKYGIFKVPVTASDSTAPSVVGADIETPDVFAADSTALYFSSQDKQIIYRAPVDGSGVTQLTANAVPMGAVVVNSTLYWIDFNTSALMSIPTAGGMVATLTGVNFGGQMLAEGTTLYFNDTSDETINRWAPGDKNPTALAMFGLFAGAGDFAVKNGDIYYTQEGFGCGGVDRIPRGGSKGSRIANGFDSASSVIVDADNVYVVAWNGVFKFHR